MHEYDLHRFLLVNIWWWEYCFWRWCWRDKIWSFKI